MYHPKAIGSTAITPQYIGKMGHKLKTIFILGAVPVHFHRQLCTLSVSLSCSDLQSQQTSGQTAVVSVAECDGSQEGGSKLLVTDILAT